MPKLSEHNLLEIKGNQWVLTDTWLKGGGNGCYGDQQFVLDLARHIMNTSKRHSDRHNVPDIKLIVCGPRLGQFDQ